ncbi:unnamed protein product [Thelazia callipaeda]|uniref:Uncharacterized protein n=1 Tax=Thelazia callipaeda TaxID=103827 RepID=A0A0N5D455_THECL|nr:unnamed protein product [Thelazia callipaeda]
MTRKAMTLASFFLRSWRRCGPCTMPADRCSAKRIPPNFEAQNPENYSGLENELRQPRADPYIVRDGVHCARNCASQDRILHDYEDKKIMPNQLLYFFPGLAYHVILSGVPPSKVAT